MSADTLIPCPRPASHSSVQPNRVQTSNWARTSLSLNPKPRPLRLRYRPRPTPAVTAETDNPSTPPPRFPFFLAAPLWLDWGGIHLSIRSCLLLVRKSGSFCCCFSPFLFSFSDFVSLQIQSVTCQKKKKSICSLSDWLTLQFVAGLFSDLPSISLWRQGSYLVAEALFLHGASFRGESMFCLCILFWVCVRFA